jgi:DNA-binding NarL/FixJ family response regulator
MKQVLVLEANAVFRECLAIVLEWSTELQTLQAGSVEGARRALADPRNEVELAIVDVGSPNGTTSNGTTSDGTTSDGTTSDGNPLELIEELRGSDPHLPVLALTADWSVGRRARALRAGANQVFDSSGALEEIIDSVRRLVGGPLSGSQTRTATEVRRLLRKTG